MSEVKTTLAANAKSEATVAPDVASSPKPAIDRKKFPGLQFRRYFTKPSVSPYDTVEWETRTASITGDKGKVFFEQKDIEIPRAWSQTATNVVAQKYFRGVLGSPARERSVKQLLGRVVDTLARWGEEDGVPAVGQKIEGGRS